MSKRLRNRTSADRLRVLVIRLEAWEGIEDEDEAERVGEELLLDIKQCLESILEDEPVDGRQPDPLKGHEDEKAQNQEVDARAEEATPTGRPTFSRDTSDAGDIQGDQTLDADHRGRSKDHRPMIPSDSTSDGPPLDLEPIKKVIARSRRGDLVRERPRDFYFTVDQVVALIAEVEKTRTKCDSYRAEIATLQREADERQAGPYEAQALYVAAETLARLPAERLDERRWKIVAIVRNGAEWCSRFEAELTRLRASAPPVAPSWQPIETAPKDGTEVVLIGTLWSDPAQRPRACVSRYCRSRDESPAYALGWFFSAPGYSSGFSPTHWMPLPDPPVAPSKENNPR